MGGRSSSSNIGSGQIGKDDFRVIRTEGGFYGVYAGDQYLTGYDPDSYSVEDATRLGRRYYDAYISKQRREAETVYTYDDIKRTVVTSYQRKQGSRIATNSSTRIVWKVGDKEFLTRKDARQYVDSRRKQ